MLFHFIEAVVLAAVVVFVVGLLLRAFSREDIQDTLEGLEKAEKQVALVAESKIQAFEASLRAAYDHLGNLGSSIELACAKAHLETAVEWVREHHKSNG